VPALARKALEQFRFINNQVALQDGVGHRSDQAQLERVAVFIGVIYRVADFLAERPLDGVGIADGRDF